MEAFVRLSAVAAPMDLPNIDTDRIIPARFLRCPRESGYGRLLFHDVRFDAGGVERQEFVLNHPAYRAARILVTAENFGCGSSREHAPWALLDQGFRCVIAPSFADIFYNNCFQNGILPVVLKTDEVQALIQAVLKTPGFQLTVDLENQTVTTPSHTSHRFDIDPFRKRCLYQGLDSIGLTLQHEAAITAYETRRKTEVPWLFADPRP